MFGVAAVGVVMEGVPTAVMDRMAEREPLVRPVSARAKPVLLVWLLLGSVVGAAVGVVVLRRRAFSEVVCQRPTGLSCGTGTGIIL